jgi:uncharacterized protein (TIGR00661 family)
MAHRIPSSSMENSARKSVLVGVLDWGLGHATRCVPLIHELLKQNADVVLAGSGYSLVLLKEEFPQLVYYELPSYKITYPKRALMFLLLLQLPRVIRAIAREEKMAGEIIKNEKIDFIISDNRYGCYSKKIRSVFMGHQLDLPMPSGLGFLSNMVNSIHRKLIKRFDHVWIPDEENGFHFSGRLSQSIKVNSRRIGMLSRFSGVPQTNNDHFEIVAVLSGPEPQRTIFENILKLQLMRSKRKSLLVKGKPGKQNRVTTQNLTEIDHLNSVELESILSSAYFIVTRSGYSSIMDLAVLGKKVLLIPTPGQIEQEYLAEYLKSNKFAITQKQDELDLENALDQFQFVKPLPKTIPNIGLAQAITELICG